MTRIVVVTLLLIGAGFAAAQPAPEPLAGIAESITSGDAEDARKKLTAVLGDAQRRQDTTREGLCLLLRGIAAVAVDDVAAARDDFANSRSRFDAVRDHFGAWLALLALAELEHAETRHDAAIAAYREALAVLGRAAASGETLNINHVTVLGGYAGFGPLPKVGETVAPEVIKPVLLLFLEPLTRDGHLSALVDGGRLTEAEAELTTLRQTSHRLGGMQDASIAMHAADLRRRQWRFDDARAEYVRALSASRMRVPFVPQDETFDLRILSKLAELEVLTGDAGAALSWNDRALALTRSSNNLRREAGVLHERGNLLYRAGRLDGAAAALQQALRTAELARAPGRRGEILFDLALLDLTRGRYGTAVSRYEKAIRSFREGADPTGESGAWVMLSHTYSLMNLHAQAQSAMKTAKKVAAGHAPLPASQLAVALASLAQRHLAGEAIGDELADVLRRIAWSAEARDSLWEPSTAETIVRFVRDPSSAVEKASLPPELMLFYGTMQSLARGRRLIDAREYSAARTVLQKGLQSNPSHEFRAAFLALIGLSWAAEGNAEGAEGALSQAAAGFDLGLEDIRVEELLSGYLGSGRTVYFDLLVESLLTRNDVARAFEITERARARAFLQLVGNARIAAGRGADPELVREAEALRMQLASRAVSLLPARPETVPQEVRELRLRYESLLTRIKTTSSEYAALTAVHPVGVADIAAELPADTTLISYFATRWGVHAWLVGRSTIQHVLLPDGAEAMVEASCWAGRLGRRRGVVDPRRTTSCPDSSEALYRLLFAPLRARLATRRVIVEAAGRRALLIGIDDYTASRLGRPRVDPPPDRDWLDLAGPVNDTGILRQMLVLRYGFAKDDIVTLTDQQATRQAILAAIENHLVKPAAKDDVLVFYFAGHGSQVRNSLSDEPDRLDESLVPADSRLGARDIRDKELRRLFNAVLDRGARLTVILDTCHSGSGARGLPAGAPARAVKPDRRDVADGSRMPPRPEERGALVLAATQDFDQAWETRDIDGKFHGVFSWALFRAMRDSSADENASDVFLRARARMRAETPLQEPVMSGTAEVRHAPLFSAGGGRRSARPAASVERVLDDGTVLLQGGWANGFSIGTELRVVGDRSLVARLRVVEMLGLGRSRARVGPGRTLPRNVRSGALLEVAAWAAPPGRPLHIWMPRASGGASAVATLARRLHAAARRRGIAWIVDPTEHTPSHLLRRGNQGWELLASGKVTGRLGTNPDEVIAALANVPPRASLFVQLPAPAAMVDGIAAGAVADGIVVANGPEDADYILLARYAGGRVQYAWVRPRVTSADRRRTGLPLRSDCSWKMTALTICAA